MKWLLLLLVPLTCFAEQEFIQGKTVKVSWQHPTQREDGSPLSHESISHYALWWGCDNGNSEWQSISADKTSVLLDGSKILGHCRVILRTVESKESKSEPVTLSIFIKLPKPTTGGFR